MDDPLILYAQNGFDDLNITGNSSYRYGTMFCTEDYSESCSINQGDNSEEWICDVNGTATCNTGIITTMVPTIQPSSVPTSLPTTIPPTSAPSQSPTQYPITYSDFRSAAVAFFEISGWTISQISGVNGDLKAFISFLTGYIHQGFDNDDGLEYRNIVLNISSINYSPLDDLYSARDSYRTHILWSSLDDGMHLKYVIKCSDDYLCEYITREGTSLGMDRVAFEGFVTNKLYLYFVDLNSTTDSTLNFSIDNLTLMTIKYDSEVTRFEIRFDSTILLIGMLSFVLLVSATCSFIALITVHSHRPGSDRPNYLSLFKFGFNVADFYTDVIWTLTLVFEQSEYAIYAMVFTFGSYAISIIVGISYVIRWKASRRSKLYLSEYGEQYGKVVLICSALAGFYATSELVTSHLCHLSVLSLHMTAAQHQEIQLLRILNIVLLENLPLLILQILYLSSADDSDERSVNLTMITIMFSSLSIISGISNIITILFSRCISNHSRNDSMEKRILFEFTLKEQFAGNIKSYHVHSHNRLQRAIAESLQLTKNQVVIYKVQKISGGLMVMGKLKFLSEEQIEHLKEELENQHSAMRINLKRECVDNLKIKVARYVELNDIKLELIDESRGGNALVNKLSEGNLDADVVMSDIVRIAEGIKMPKVIENPHVADTTPFEPQMSVDGEVYSEDGVEGAETQ